MSNHERSMMKHVDKTQKILTKKFEIDKTLFENLLNHDISKLYTPNYMALGSIYQLYTALEVYNSYIQQSVDSHESVRKMF